MINKINYVAIAGDSGGHIFPAIKYINELSQINKDLEFIVYVDPLSIDNEYVEKNNFFKKIIILNYYYI